MSDIQINGDKVRAKFSKVVRKTEKAALVAIGDEEIWLPLSQIKKVDDGVMEMPQWLAAKKGLCDEQW